MDTLNLNLLNERAKYARPIRKKQENKKGLDMNKMVVECDKS